MLTIKSFLNIADLAMCGINGIFAFNSAATAPDRAELIATREHMHARGPDSAGEWWDATRRIGFGHRRLSILDLSERANQPMQSACGRFVVVFNGEIYNYPELRARLEQQGRTFRTTSDTEVLLHLYEIKQTEMVHDLRGMFAFAIWDNTARTVFLARDPYGIKPLYVANDGWTVRFASQVKALLAGGKVSRDPEPAGIVGFHLWGSVPEPFTLYRDIRALPAGHWQMIDEAGPGSPQSFSSIAALFAAPAAPVVDAHELRQRLRDAVGNSVSAHLLSDVEVGLFLSAGIDSSALLGMMRDAGQDQIKAVTLTFSEFEGTPDDEAPLATQVARRFGAEQYVRRIGQAEFAADFPDILNAMDQPSIDGINSWFVCKAAKEAGLKVALSGLGGDELLGGYPSFRDIPRWVRWMKMPASVPGLGKAARVAMSWAKLGSRNPKSLGMLEYGGTYAGGYLLRRGLFMPFELRTVVDPEIVAKGLRRLQLVDCLEAAMPVRRMIPGARIASLESTNYMRNQLLRDADWTSMAHSIEVRTPLVDATLLATLAPVLPQLLAGPGKKMLASAPSSPLPDAITDRAKTGFSIPLGRWLSSNSSDSDSTRGHTSRQMASQVMNTFAMPMRPPALTPSTI